MKKQYVFSLTSSLKVVMSFHKEAYELKSKLAILQLEPKVQELGRQVRKLLLLK